MAIKFNGSNNKIVSDSTFVPPSDVTVLLWTRPLTLSGTQRIFGSDAQFEAKFSSKTLISDIYEGNNINATIRFSTYTWYHLAFTRDGTSKDGKIYIDGLIDITSLGTQTGTPSTANMAIGSATGSTDYYKGEVDDFRIYDRVLSDKEIQTIYATRGTDGIVNGLLHRLPMNENGEGLNVSGSGSVKDIGPSTVHYSPTSVPLYRGSILKYRRENI